jgi:hypothetical protein
MRDCFFTSIALNYLPKALALAESVFAVHPDTRMVIAIVDLRWLSPRQSTVLERVSSEFEARGHRLEFLDPLALYERADLFRYKLNVVEACTSVKPAVAAHLLETAQIVTYLDPDTLLYAPIPASADEAWDFQVTPHVLAPAGTHGVISERLFMFYGSYNLGYFAVRRSPQGLAFLAWWKQFCIDYGADAPQAGLFVDQKPVDLLPSFVDRVSVLRHPGCNMAWWNIFCDGRRLDDGGLVVFGNNREHLVFFHFSNLDRMPDPSRRLVANPLGLYQDKPGLNRRLADHPPLQRLFADYEGRAARWQVLARELGVPEARGARTQDVAVGVRLLLSEALRRGMEYPGDPFEQHPGNVAWRAWRYVWRHSSRRDLHTAIAAVRMTLRLTLATSLLRHTN